MNGLLYELRITATSNKNDAARYITAGNIGIAVGLDVETSAVCIAVLLFGHTSFNLVFCCYTSTLYFQLGSGSGLVIKYPTCSNTCPLAHELAYATLLTSAK